MNRIGLNADCRALGSNRQRFIDFIVALRPPYILLMDDDDCKVADEIHARAPQVNIIHRKYNPHEGNLWRMVQDDGSLITPQEYLDYLKTHNRPYIIHNVLNEPAPPKGEIAGCLKWLCELMKLAHEQHMMLCVLNMQSVAIRFDELDAGVYDEFLFTCAKYASWHVVGYHEYGLADVRMNVSGAFMFSLVNRSSAPYIPMWQDMKPREAHIGRIQIVVDRMRKIGATPIPPFVATEYGDDKVEISEYQLVVGLNANVIPLGIPSMREYYQRMYNDTAEHLALQQFSWTNDTFPDYVKGFCWFAWNYNPEWAGFNVGELVDLQREWIVYADRVRSQLSPSEPPTVPPPTDNGDARDWRARLADSERLVLSLAKAGELGTLERLILHMASMLDE